MSSLGRAGSQILRHGYEVIKGRPVFYTDPRTGKPYRGEYGGEVMKIDRGAWVKWTAVIDYLVDMCDRKERNTEGYYGNDGQWRDPPQ